MELSQLPLLLVLAPLLLISSLCAATETALFSLSYSDRLLLRRRHPGAAEAVGVLLSRPRALLVTVLLLTNIANVGYYVVSSVVALNRGSEAPPGRRALLSVAIGVALVLALILLSDLLPKLLARRLRVEFCVAFARPALAVFRAIAPVQRFLEHAVVAPLSRLVRPRVEPRPSLTMDEVSALLQASTHEGALRTEEQSLLEEVVQLGAVRVRDAMTPRMDIPWLELGATVDELLVLVRERGCSRAALCRGTLDGEVLGWVDVKRALSARGDGHGPRLADFLRPMLFVPETARLDQLLDLLRQSRRYAALCVDEHGTIVGMIDIDHVLARLAGEPAVEAEGEHEALEPCGPGQWDVPGRLALRDLCGILDTPEQGLLVRGRPVERRVATVAGLILLSLGRLPRIGDEVRFGAFTLRVESLRGRAIERVRISAGRTPAAPAGERA